jgi:hypothetical protein
MARYMKYIEYRSKIKSGDLLAWSHRSWKTWYDIKIQLVRIFTQSEYSHVGVAWVYQDRVFVIESVTPFVRIVPLSNLLPCYVISMNLPWSKETENLALGMVGKAGYSQLEAIKAYFGKNKDPNAWECAEFVQKIYRSENLNLDCKDVPSDLVLAAQKRFGPTVYLEE